MHFSKWTGQDVSWARSEFAKYIINPGEQHVDANLSMKEYIQQKVAKKIVHRQI